ncbi:hypothetical protein [Candidatus Chloroploca asiatica]|uniref:Uncharacterized protein n=1 Tax=Candidatus Chloroploca asiatica TaxID=1506545 RepID=A0A2H3KIW2_9CHLR|nr:hypothetical protein [Candidatus Chloroploca asiatica]PDV97088.1 hypothetical protein A9Q02_19405 [Candidatus Chloroploca asiatica]
MTNYTEQDTERQRLAEHSSAGMPTQSLGQAINANDLTPRWRDRLDPRGLVLIVLGLAWLLISFVAVPEDVTGGFVLLLIGSVFYFFGFWRHIYGLIIPASILAGLSVGVTFASLTDGVSVLWGLALGFLAVYGLGRAIFAQKSQWPLIPAVILFAVGAIVAVANLPSFLSGLLLWVPLLLIGAGLYLGSMRR